MNKVVLITGATRGIGKSCVYKFASCGYNVIVNYVNSDELASDIKKDIENKYDVEVLPIKADISDENQVKSMCEEVISKFGKIDVLINNAGIAMDSLVSDKTKESFNKVLDVNLVGTFLVSKYVSKYMLEKKSGKIINVSSTNGIDTYYPYSMDYDAAKAGVISLTHNFATYLAPYINVNCVAPGWVNTDMNSDLDEDYKKEEADKILFKRFAECEEIANVIYFLSTDEAKYINSTVIRVDGGVCK